MNSKGIIERITDWSKNKIIESKQKGFVVGISGGIDSAVVSNLCAMTGYPVICLSMPINSSEGLSTIQMEWLKSKYANVTAFTVDLSKAFNTFLECLPLEATKEIALINTMSRLRMATLYAFSGSCEYLVAGTGNKIEDYGIGFFTKYGDGGVDISPIGSLKKTEVFTIAKYMEIPKSIQEAKPTDGLWEDGRSDEDQIGATYKDLEWAMVFCDGVGIKSWSEFLKVKPYLMELTEAQEKILNIYLSRHEQNEHKMEMPPICRISNKLF